VIAVDGYTVADDGSHTDSVGIGRLGADGQPDPAFGSSGFAYTDFGVAHADEIYGARAIARRGRGGWVVGGTGPDGFAFVGFTASGALDPAFGSGGKAVVDADPKARENMRVMRELPDGGVLAAGTGSNGSIVVLKLRPDGTLDPAYGKGGKVKLTMKPLIGYGRLRGIEDMVLQGSKAVITGPALVYDYAARKYRNQGILLRLKANGALDRSFGR
jgi:uncharacterized delta-60 repeat protein